MKEQMAQNGKQVAHDIQEHAQSAKETLKSRSREAQQLLSETASELGGHAKEAMDKAGDQIKHQSVQMRDVICNYVEEKPFTALGIAALVGLGLGILLKK